MFSATLLILLQAVLGVHADYVVRVDLEFFVSPSLKRITLSRDCCVCCEEPISNTCPSSCNATILVCLREPSNDTSDTRSCPLGALTGPAEPNTTELVGIFPGPWQGVAQIPITFFHYTNDTADVGTVADRNFLDLTFINELKLPPSTSPTLTANYTGDFFAFSIAFQVICAQNFFGPLCNMMCENRDDDLGHFSCDPITGERVCLEGYVNVEGNCTDCAPRLGCSPIGGFCDEPGQCICLAGFMGGNCSENITGSTASQLPSRGFTTATQTELTPTSMLINLVSSAARLPSLVPTQSTMMLQLPSISSVTLMSSSSALDLPLPAPTPTDLVTPGVGLNRVDKGSNKLLYIIVGTVGGAVMVVLISLTGFALVVVTTHKQHKRKALKEQQQKNENRFTDVVTNIEASSRFTSSSTLNKNDPYLDTIVIPEQDSGDDTANAVLPRPTYSTFQQEDRGILTQESADEEDIYATPIVLTNRGAQPQPLHKDHDYDVLECADLTIKEAESAKYEHTNEDDLLESIERTMNQIHKELQDQAALPAENNTVSAGSDFSFIYADQLTEERGNDDIHI